MGIPAQVRERLCIVIGVLASALLLMSFGIEPIPSNAPPAGDLAILELSEPFPEARVLDPRPEPPAPAETVFVLGYPDGSLRATNAIVHQGNETFSRYAGLALLEVQGSNRLLLDHG